MTNDVETLIVEPAKQIHLITACNVNGEDSLVHIRNSIRDKLKINIFPQKDKNT